MSTETVDITLHQGLVLTVAHKYKNMCTSTVSFEDLCQAGNLGLLRAAKDYDEARGSFSNYALYWIRDAIANELGTHSRTIAIPRHEMRKAASDKRPYPKNACTLDLDKIQSDEVSSEESLDRQSQYKLARKEMLNLLTPLQQQVLVMRFTHDMMLNEVGEKLGYSREWVRQQEKKALSILKNKMVELNGPE